MILHSYHLLLLYEKSRFKLCLQNIWGRGVILLLIQFPQTTFKGRVFMTHATKAIYRWLLSDYIKVRYCVQ